MINAAFAFVATKELFRISVCLILFVAGWWLATYLALSLHFANDTIRMLRANAKSEVTELTQDEKDAVEIVVQILEAGEVPKILRPHLLATLRGLLERTEDKP